MTISSLRTPEFITFTGLDARTDLARALHIATVYPVEFGVLFSGTRQGREPRYPDRKTITHIACAGLPRLAAHVCGGYAWRINTNTPTGLNLTPFRRVQVNHPSPDAGAIAREMEEWGRPRGVAQTRDLEFPASTMVDWLFDRSAGEGKAPEEWPQHPGGDRLVGYAGGIGPGNVGDVLRKIAATGPYWIDMESGVRTDDWLDLDKVEAVCRAFYR
ncbi:hypothetical protein [Azospirillum argentinense]|uniref:hypothetical protein n=1 Tax=Azospirillum argentinense TaxID=2970906 RepID=UPI001FFF5579|nr:hypothetical protein [Azospirillum argentinense]